MSETAPEATGTCFSDAFNALVSLLDGGEYPSISLRVAHGMVDGQGPVEGWRFLHAWLEVDGCTVIDASYLGAGGDPLVMDASQYYMVGGVKDTELCRYTVPEAFELLQKHGHSGPWADRWQDEESTVYAVPKTGSAAVD